MDTKNKLYKRLNNNIIFGVCCGLSQYFNCDAWTFRILLILSAIINFKFGIINYIALSLVMSNK